AAPKMYLQRTNSFDGVSINGGASASAHCDCNCGDWLLDFAGAEDPNDPFGSILTTGDADLCKDSGALDKTFEELADIFTKPHQSQHHLTPLMNGFCTSPKESKPLEGARDQMVMKLNGSINGLPANGFKTMPHLNGLRVKATHLEPKSSTSSSSGGT